MRMVPKSQYDHALKRMYQLFEMGLKKEQSLEAEVTRLQCVIKEQTAEIRQLRDDLYGEIGSTSS